MMPLRRYRDRLGTWTIGPWWLRLTWTMRPFAYTLYCLRRRLLFKPIDYTKAGERA